MDTLRNNFRLLLIGTLAFLILAMASCSASGYGCHGRGKIITRVKGNGY